MGMRFLSVKVFAGPAAAAAWVLTCLRWFDAAAAGLGGCPFAPGATGNTATEDLVFAFELMGLSTGIHLDRLLEAADLAARIEGGRAGGRVRLLPRENVLAGLL